MDEKNEKDKDDDPKPAKPEAVLDDSTPTGKTEDTEDDKKHKEELSNPSQTFDDPKFREANG